MPNPYNFKFVDRFAKKAKEEGFRARSVYKLIEIDRRFYLFWPGQKVLDIGAAPGSWLQYATFRIGPKGKAVGLDNREIKQISPNVSTFVCDILEQDQREKTLAECGIDLFDLIISDIAPNTTGIKYVDQKRSVKLNQAVLEIAKKHLQPKGKMVIKVFPGEDLGVLMDQLRQTFSKVKIFRSQASKKSSSEIYLICY